jgi:hypothetical protein
VIAAEARSPFRILPHIILDSEVGVKFGERNAGTIMEEHGVSSRANWSLSIHFPNRNVAGSDVEEHGFIRALEDSQNAAALAAVATKDGCGFTFRACREFLIQWLRQKRSDSSSRQWSRKKPAA